MRREHTSTSQLTADTTEHMFIVSTLCLTNKYQIYSSLKNRLQKNTSNYTEVDTTNLLTDRRPVGLEEEEEEEEEEDDYINPRGK